MNIPFLPIKKLNILVLGSNGMLGYDVVKKLRLFSHDKNSIIGIVHGFDSLNSDGYVNLTIDGALALYLEHSIHYDFCINCAAYTNTAKIEDGTAYKESYELNALAPKYIAQACHKFGTKFIHISTDYVFSEYCSDLNIAFQSPAYAYPNSTPFPKNTYGLHKLLGEQFIQNEMNKDEYVICRTSWLYGIHNNKSFIHRFIKNVLLAIDNGKTSIDVSSNEYSIPTSTEHLACEIYHIIFSITHDKWKNIDSNIIHAVPCADKLVSRADFAREILADFTGFNYKGADISSVIVNDVERTAYHPVNSTLKSTGLFMRTLQWSDGLWSVCNKSTFDWAINEVEKTKKVV